MISGEKAAESADCRLEAVDVLVDFKGKVRLDPLDAFAVFWLMKRKLLEEKCDDN